jgi:stalled ribosome rescue protein Dom34
MGLNSLFGSQILSKESTMSACIVWIDSEHAKIFNIAPSGVEKKQLKLHAPGNPVGAHHDNHKHNAEEHFFHQVATALGHPEELLIFGAGMAKTHFKTHLEKHKHAPLIKSLVGVESLDHLTDNQILEAGRKFFKKFNTYNSTI